VKQIKREMYLSRIRPFYESDLIKILVGIRRCGKSVILDQIAQELRDSGIESERVIYVNFELMDYSGIRDAASLVAFVKSRMTLPGRYYLLFDEIQKVDGFEEGINSLRASHGCSIFITGSNGRLLSSELKTDLTGRYVTFRIRPFTYREVKSLLEENGRDVGESAFYDFMKWGGMPQRFRFEQEREVRAYLSDLYDSIVLNEVVSRFKVMDPDLLERIMSYIVDNSSRLFSVNSIVEFLKREGRPVSTSTVYNYVDHVLSSLIVDNVKRYDTKGKRILAAQGKFYCADTGLRQVRSADPNSDIGALLETIVHNELIARGYEVRVGKTPKAEIDFIATRDGGRIYIQVCYMMLDERIAQREFSPFSEISDNYPKYVLSMDKFDMSSDGVRHLNLVDGFLLSEEI